MPLVAPAAPPLRRLTRLSRPLCAAGACGRRLRLRSKRPAVAPLQKPGMHIRCLYSAGKKQHLQFLQLRCLGSSAIGSPSWLGICVDTWLCLKSMPSAFIGGSDAADLVPRACRANSACRAISRRSAMARLIVVFSKTCAQACGQLIRASQESHGPSQALTSWIARPTSPCLGDMLT